MSKITVKSTKSVILAAYEDAIRELELTKRQLADVTTEKGILLSQLEERNQQVKLLNEEVELLKQSYDEIEAQLIDAEANKFTRAEVEELIALEVADRMATKPPASPKKPAPKPQIPVSEIESQPAVEITDTDRRVWSAFKALPREKRQAYYEFARATVGHLGIHNIVAVREAYLAKQAA